MIKAERGLSESVQWAVLLPVVLGSLFGMFEAGAWLYGRSVATEAAQAGVESHAISAQTSQSMGVAEGVASDGGLGNIQVRVWTESLLCYVEVTGEVPSFIGWFDLTVSATATRPKELP